MYDYQYLFCYRETLSLSLFLSVMLNFFSPFLFKIERENNVISFFWWVAFISILKMTNIWVCLIINDIIQTQLQIEFWFYFWIFFFLKSLIKRGNYKKNLEVFFLWKRRRRVFFYHSLSKILVTNPLILWNILKRIYLKF